MQEPVYFLTATQCGICVILGCANPCWGKGGSIVRFFIFLPSLLHHAGFSSNQVCFSGSSHALLELAERGRT